MPFKPLTALVLAWLAGLSLTGLPRTVYAAEQMPVDLELLLAIDISGSIDADEARLQREGYARALLDKDVLKAIRGGIHGKIAIAYFDWSDSYVQSEILDWTLIQDEASARAVSQRLLDTQTRTARRTSISGAIHYAIPRFGTGPYKGMRRVLDISGDGPNNDGDMVDLARDKALAAGIVINGLPILNGKQNTWGFPQLEDLDRYYEGCVIGGPGAFVVVAESFETFHEAVRRKLILEIATAPAVPPAWQRIGPPVFHKAQSSPASRYPKGCDIGERQSREFWRRRFDQ
jgi:hypothetical protein